MARSANGMVYLSGLHQVVGSRDCAAKPMYTKMNAVALRMAAAIPLFALVPACAGDAEKLFTVVAEQKTVEVGVADAEVSLGRGRQRVDLSIPANALPMRRSIKVSLTSGTVRRGRHPVSDSGVLIEPVGSVFQAPVRVRQFVPPPPAGRAYRTVVIPDNGALFVVRSRARLIQPASAENEGYEQWEGDSSGSGLWGLALEEMGDDALDPRDAGAPEASTPDASTNTCTPATSAGCGRNQGCALSCLASGETVSTCVAAGAKQPGELCTGAGECAPGSQCFKACGVSVCRRYCTADTQCPAGGSCYSKLSCPIPLAGNTGRVCSQPCDPRGAAQTGCATGLRCLIFPGEVADCDCPAATRIGVDGTACTDTGSCAPSFICVNTGTTSCRPICRLDQPNTCPAGRTCQRLTNPDHKVFGACAP